jgi:hypothetical protein
MVIACRSFAPQGASVIVVEAALHDDQVVSIDFVNQPVLLGDSPGPPSIEIVPERFRFADAGKWIPQSIPDDFVDSAEDFPVGFLPV